MISVESLQKQMESIHLLCGKNRTPPLSHKTLFCHIKAKHVQSVIDGFLLLHLHEFKIKYKQTVHIKLIKSNVKNRKMKTSSKSNKNFDRPKDSTAQIGLQQFATNCHGEAIQHLQQSSILRVFQKPKILTSEKVQFSALGMQLSYLNI